MRVLRSLALALLLAAVVASQPLRDAGYPTEHDAWLLEALTRMLTIKPGMTRAELLEVFTTEGGMYSALRRTFVYRGSPYLKVDVEFEAVGRPARDDDGRLTRVESPYDTIRTISRPYVEGSIGD